jgi:hypothetical protein
MRNLSAKSCLLIAAATVALGGCGNSGSPPPPATAAVPSPARPRLSRAEFARAAGKICARLGPEIGAFIPLGTDPTTRRANRSGVIAVIRRINGQLRALGYPVGASSRTFDDVYRGVDAAMLRAANDETVDIDKLFFTAANAHGGYLAKYAPACKVDN